MTKKMQKKISSIVGILLIAVAIVFIVFRLNETDIDYEILTSPRTLIMLGAVAVFTTIYMIILIFNYRAWIFNVSNIKLPAAPVLTVYSAANLYKYIPGGVLTIAGRNKLAVDFDELSHGKVAVATLFESVFFAIGAVVVTFIFAFEHTVRELGQVDNLRIIIIIALIVLAVLAILVYIFRSQISKLFSKSDMWNAVKPSVLIKRMTAALALSIAWSATFLFVLMAIGPPMTLDVALSVLGLFMFAWLAGFIVPVAPAGLGIREAALIIFLGGIVAEEYLLLAIMAHRIVIIFSDILTYLVTLGYAKIKEAQSHTETLEQA